MNAISIILFTANRGRHGTNLNDTIEWPGSENRGVVANSAQLSLTPVKDNCALCLSYVALKSL